MPPSKGDDGEVYVHSRVFGDNTMQRVNVACFCLDVLNVQLYPGSPFISSIAGPRHGRIFVNADTNPHWLDLNFTPPHFGHLKPDGKSSASVRLYQASAVSAANMSAT